VDLELNEEQQAFRDAAREFAQARMAPFAAQWDAEHHFPRDVIAAGGELGFCGLYANPDIGGLGVSRLSAAMVFEELATACPSTAAYFTIHNMATWMLGTWAPDEVRGQWGEALTSGRKLASYCLTEPGSGSDAACIKTRAERVEGGYRLTGSKIWISNANLAEFLVVFAKTAPDGGQRGMSAFLVPTSTPGYVVARLEDKLGQHSSDTAQINFDDCRIPADNLIGAEGEGYKIALSRAGGRAHRHRRAKRGHGA